MATVILDAAHGGRDIGLISGNRMEKTDNLNLSLAVGKILEGYGVNTIYTRTSDKELSQLDRLKIANESKGDVYFAFHRMYGGDINSSPGVEFYIEQDNESSTIGAENIRKNLDNVGFKSYGIKENISDILIDELDIPVIHMNLGFMDSEADNKLYDEKFQEIAKVIADGIMEVLKTSNKIEEQTYHNTNLQKESGLDDYEGTYEKRKPCSCKNMPVKVILDAGHGGNDMGTVYRDRLEKKDNLRLTLEIGRRLKKKGVIVIYTRNSDQSVLPLERVKIANQERGDILLSIHRMTGTIPKCHHGVEAFINGDDELGEAVALNIGDNLYGIGYHNHGIYSESEVTLLKNTIMPAIMLMIGYIDSERDNELFDFRFHEIAEAVANGILVTFGINGGDNTMQDHHINQENLCHYRVQIGLFKTYINAIKCQNIMINKGFQTQIAIQGDYYSIQVGDFSNLDEAVNLERLLKHQEYHTLIVAL